MADFEKAFKEILLYEGGYSDDEHDRGGKTRFGVTEAVARRHEYQGDMKDIPLQTAWTIYKKDYWDTLKLDDVIDDKTATEVFDISVNMGPNVAGRMLQRALNLINRNEVSWKDIKVDGIVGQETINTLNSLKDFEYPYLYKCLNGLQFLKYVDIVTHNPVQEKFFRGWLRRV